jgi:hypothetical protein
MSARVTAERPLHPLADLAALLLAQLEHSLGIGHLDAESADPGAIFRK